MDDLRVAALIRIARRRLRLRQADVARLAGVSQQTISRIERAELDRFNLRMLRRVASAVGVALPFEPWVRDRDAVRLLDARHLALVEATATRLREIGWSVRLEFSYNHFGERGCLDILGWSEARRAVVLPEIKSTIVDVQALLRSFDVRHRVVPVVFARELGWKPEHVASLLVLPSESAARRTVGAQKAFDLALPSRTVDVRRWLREPHGELRGVWFLPLTPGGRVIRNPGSPGRIRRRGGEGSDA